MSDVNIQEAAENLSELLRGLQGSWDKTVAATVVECRDESEGLYVVEYCGGRYGAVAALDSNSQNRFAFPIGTTVYFKMPSENIQDGYGQITGTIKQSSTAYIAEIDKAEAEYNIVGTNLIPIVDFKKPGVNLCSYHTVKEEDEVIQKHEKTIYALQNPEEEEKFKEYLEYSDFLILKFKIKTNLPVEHQRQGAYGIRLSMDFKDDITRNILTKTVEFTNNSMIGSPYNFVNETEQIFIYQIDGKNFSTEKKEGISVQIEGFCRDFAISDSSTDNKIEDIFISDVEMYAAVKKAQDSSSGTIDFAFPNETFISEKRPIKEKPIKVVATFYNNGVPVSADNEKLSFFWFKQDALTTRTTEGFNVLGGSGWRCLNDVVSEYITDKETEKTTKVAVTPITWLSATDTFTLESDEELQQKINTFMCVAKYGEHSYKKTFEIKNLSADYDVTIESSNGTNFSFNNGDTKLTATIDRKLAKEENYIFIWTRQDSDGKEMVQVQKSKNPVHLESDTLEISSIADINGYADYICTVQLVTEAETKTKGSASIRIIHSIEPEYKARVELVNGTMSFKYDENGLSPTGATNLVPLTLKPISFNFYDDSGNLVPNDSIPIDNIKWHIPTTNDTMLVLTKDKNDAAYSSWLKGDNEIGKIVKAQTLSYNIATSYDMNKTNNTIKLEIEYQDKKYYAETNFTFTKEGEPGTNGSQFFCQIENDNGTYKARLYKGDENVLGNYTFDKEKFESATAGDGTPFTIRWKMLTRNDGKIVTVKENGKDKKYTLYTTDYQINEGNIKIRTNPNRENTEIKEREEVRENILQVEIIYDEKRYYATYPIRTMSGNWKVEDGFNYIVYNSNGKNPQYDKKHPFRIEGEDLEITLLGDDLSKGELEKTVENGYTIINIKPPNEYNGYSYNNAILIKKIEDGEEKGRIHIPIHLMLNRYGNANINGWDGNSIDLGQDTGTILAPQVGAGEKDKNNLFTGVLMGVEKPKEGNEEIGLFGYNKGQRSIFLDAKTGKAEFGIGAKIIIDPSKDESTGKEPEAKIYSGNYQEEESDKEGAGMMIDFQTPEIRFGSGDFRVGSTGDIHSKSGDIAGWNIGPSTLTKGKVGLSSESKGNIAFWAGAESKNKASAPFRVNFDGSFHSTSGDIGGWLITNKDFKSSKDATDFIPFSQTDWRDKLKEAKGVSLSTQGLRIGSSFAVSANGSLVAKYGFIGEMKIADEALYTGPSAYPPQAKIKDLTNAENIGGSLYLGPEGIRLGKTFQVDKEGKLYATSGTIAGWTLKENQLQSGDDNLPTIYLGTAGIQYTDNFSVNNKGEMSAKSGTIGGWEITSDSLQSTNGKVKLDKNGNLTGINWNLTENGFSSSGGGSGTTASGTRCGISNGKLTAVDASVEGEINATSGKIGGWVITDTALKGTEKVLLNNKGPFFLGDTTHYITWGNESIDIKISSLNVGNGDSGSFESADGKTITVTNGIITKIS